MPVVASGVPVVFNRSWPEKVWWLSPGRYRSTVASTLATMPPLAMVRLPVVSETSTGLWPAETAPMLSLSARAVWPLGRSVTPVPTLIVSFAGSVAVAAV